MVAAALLLSTLSFAAGVAGDLSQDTWPRSGTRVVMRIPPQLPADTARAAPLPVSTRAALSAAAFEPLRVQRLDLFDPLPALAPIQLHKPLSGPLLASFGKERPRVSAKHEGVHSA